MIKYYLDSASIQHLIHDMIGLLLNGLGAAKSHWEGEVGDRPRRRTAGPPRMSSMTD